MLSKLYSIALSGLEGQLVEIEVDTRMSLPGFSIVGLPDAAVQESRERVIMAIKNAGIKLPRGKIIVNLAPADLKKVGALYDLAIALGLCVFSGAVRHTDFKDTLFLGELALNGSVRSVPGVLATVEFARKNGFKRLFVPKENAMEAFTMGGIEIIPVGHLKEAILYLNGKLSTIKPVIDFTQAAVPTGFEMALIKGQSQAKRAMEIAAAGGHNLLLNGAPGAGKTMLARALSGILPQMSQEEMLEVTKIYSVAGLLGKNEGLMTQRPFRYVHHTASNISIAGGGTTPMPGEITLAHRGVLFMDEMAEFPTQTLDVLRQPMEHRQITISRARGRVTYPAQFTLVGAMNPCPCGYYNVQKFKGRCECQQFRVEQYYKKISGPLLDRIDMKLNIEPVEHKSLSQTGKHGESSETVRKRVNLANTIQRNRFSKTTIKRNVEMNSQAIEFFCPLEKASKSLLDTYSDRLGLSARSYFKAIKIARTIADLEQAENIKSSHVGEAFQYICASNRIY